MGNNIADPQKIYLRVRPQQIIINNAYKMRLQICSLQTFPHGYDGLRLWQSGIILSRYIILNSSLFKNKRILQIGAGVGIAGMTVKQWSQCKQIQITDHHPTILQNIKRNLKNNGIACPVYPLDWTKQQNNSCQYDIIMGSDVVYYGSPIQDLYRVFKRLLSDKGIGIIVIPDRYNYAEMFLKLVEPDRFQVEKQKLTNQQYFQSPLQNSVDGFKKYALIKELDFYVYKLIKKYPK